MEELKCVLLGFDSGALTHACKAAATTATTTAAHPSKKSSDGTATSSPPPLSSLLHPAEAELAARALVLGRAYAALDKVATDVATGATTGLYATAVGTGVRRLLPRYTAAVAAVASPSALLLLCDTYEVTFGQLASVVAHDGDGDAKSTRGSSRGSAAGGGAVLAVAPRTRAHIAALERFLSCASVPAPHRRLLGEAVWLSVLYVTAHYVAHGVVLHGCSDYFVSIRKAATTATTAAASSATTPKTTARSHRSRHDRGNATTVSPSSLPAAAAAAVVVEEHVLDCSLLPSAVSPTLGAAILAAGRARRLLLMRDATHTRRHRHRRRCHTSSASAVKTRSSSSRRPSDDDDDEEAQQQRAKDGRVYAHVPPLFSDDDDDDDAMCNDDDDDDDDYLSALAASACDAMALDVFASIHDTALCVHGTLAAHELEARVTAATRMWSRRLWRSIGEANVLLRRLRVLHAMYLCQRGDVWALFVQRSWDAVVRVCAECDEDSARDGLAAQERRTLQRALTTALSSALAVCGDNNNNSNNNDYNIDGSNHACGCDAMARRDDDDDDSGVTYSGFCIVLDDNSGNDSDNDNSSTHVYAGDVFARVSAVLLTTLQAMQLHLRTALPASLALVVSPTALAHYQRLHTMLLCLRFASYALQQTRQTLAAVIVTNTRASTDLRRAYALHQLMQSLLTAVSSYVQVDVLAPRTAALAAQLRDSAHCSSVDEAKRQHDRFVWHVAEECLVAVNDDATTTTTQTTTSALRAACVSLVRGAFMLYAVCCSRVRVSYWAVEGVNATPPHVATALTTLTTLLQRDVLAPFALHLGSSNSSSSSSSMTLAASSCEGALRALWTWLDMSGYLSQHRYRHLASPIALQPVTIEAPRQQQQQQQQHVSQLLHAPLPRPASSSSSQQQQQQRTVLTGIALTTPPPTQSSLSHLRPGSSSSSGSSQRTQPHASSTALSSTRPASAAAAAAVTGSAVMAASTSPTPSRLQQQQQQQQSTRIPRLRHTIDSDVVTATPQRSEHADATAATTVTATASRRAHSRTATRRSSHSSDTAASADRRT